MLTIFRRHSRTCPHTSRTYRRCSCHIHVEGSLGGELIRKALDLTSWTRREARTQVGRGGPDRGRVPASPEHRDGRREYLDGKRNKKLAESTIYKLRNIFEKQLLGWAKGKGYRHLRELTPERLSDWQTTWKDAPLAASKKYQRVVGFFYF